MTDETSAETTPSQPMESPPHPTSGMAADVSSMMAKLGPGEKFVVIGAGIILAGWVIFDLVANDYNLGHMPFLLAAAVVIAAYVRYNRPAAAWSVPYQTVLRVLAWSAVLLGVWGFIDDVRFNIFEDDVTSILGGLIYWAGIALTTIGVIQLKPKV